MSTAGETLADYDDAVSRYEPVIGLEVHVELGTASKMFCGCPTAFGAIANTQVCPVCLGLPGSMPVVNQAAIESTIRMGLALNCTIAAWCRFARKNYFYPDMPKDYQISQYDEPLCTDGYLDVAVPTDDGITTVRVEIERVHMEEDNGKLTHPRSRLQPRRLQPGGDTAGRDRHETCHGNRGPGSRRGPRLRDYPARHHAISGRLRRPDGGRFTAL